MSKNKNYTKKNSTTNIYNTFNPSVTLNIVEAVFIFLKKIVKNNIRLLPLSFSIQL